MSELNNKTKIDLTSGSNKTSRNKNIHVVSEAENGKCNQKVALLLKVNDLEQKRTVAR